MVKEKDLALMKYSDNSIMLWGAPLIIEYEELLEKAFEYIGVKRNGAIWNVGHII